MPFNETSEDYEAKLRKFAKEHPDATEDDLKALFPRMNSTAETWKKFHASALHNRDGESKSAKAD